MNRTEDSTAKAANPDFPLQHRAKRPEEDIRDALTLFEVVDVLIDTGCVYGMPKDRVANLAVLFNEARAKLEPIREYLEEDKRDGTTTLYQTARRAVIRRSFDEVPA